MKKSVITLVPMRGRSQRIPNKNLKLFAGKPLYHIIMSKLEKSNYIEKIYVDTDSQKIAEDATRNFKKTIIIERPKELRGELTSMNKIIAYDLNQIEGDHFLQTHSTNPLVTIETLHRALKLYFDNLDNYDSLFSVTRLQTRLYWQNCKALNHDPNELLRTQDLTPVFEENSNFYFFSKKSFKNSGNKRIGLKPQMFEVNKLEALDIDEPDDFILAEILYKSRLNLP